MRIYVDKVKRKTRPVKSKIAVAVLVIMLGVASATFACGPQDCTKNQTWNGTKCIDNPTPTPTTNNQSQNQSQTNSQNQSQNTSLNSTQNTSNQNVSTSGSSSKSNSNSTSQSNNTNSNSNVNALSPTLNSTNSATGGNATATNNNSGNSSNKNTNVANGGAGGLGGAGGSSNQSQSADSSSSNNSSGNSSSYSSTYKAAAETAIAVAPYPTAQCFKGGAVGGQALSFGFSASGGRIDENCAILETARNFDSVGERLAACKVKISNKYAKAAGVTLEDCMTVPLAPVPVLPAPVPASQPTIIVVPQPAPVAMLPPIAPPQTQTATLLDIGSCKMLNLKLTNVCKRMLDDAALRLDNAPTGTKLVLTGPVEAAQAASYLSNRVSRQRVEMRFSDEQNLTLDVQLFEVQ